MAMLPIEVIELGNVSRKDVARAITLVNSRQTEFQFIHLSHEQASDLRQHVYRRQNAETFLETMALFRTKIRGYHPFIIAFVDAPMDGTDFTNLFGEHRAESGLAVATVANVADVIVPGDRMVAYVIYYLARYALSFVCPDHRNHDDNRHCVFDRKIEKRHLLDSMTARPLCDHCRQALLSGNSPLAPRQLEALDPLFALAGELLSTKTPEKGSLPTAFIGSSTEGLRFANELQFLLRHDLDAVVWNRGTVFGLGDATLEALEKAVLGYNFGIFVFTPDDKLYGRGETKPVARDNVLFELGLFMGKLTRHRAFVVHPGKNSIALPSDLHGITTAAYDPEQGDLSVALGPVCESIRNGIRRMEDG
ncbi:MAG: nucleotide-binding protein [Planctomycetota bacterium]